MKQPRYAIMYTFTVNGRPGGSGLVGEFKPAHEGKPSTLLPAHLTFAKQQIETDILRDAGARANVTITGIHRYETDAEA